MAGLLDFTQDPLTQFGGLLMSGQSPFFGVNLGNAITQQGALQMQAKKEARAEEQAQLAQLVQSYSMLKQQDQQAQAMAAYSGTPYTPSPLLQQHEAKLSQLLGQPMMGAQQQGAAPGTPAALPPRPVGQPPMSQAPQQAPMQAPGQLGVPQQQGQNATLRQAAAAANIPDSIAMGMIAQGKTAELMKAITEALAPKNGPAGLSRINPQTGQMEIVGGNASPGTVPFTRDASGKLVAQPIQGAAEEVARAEALKTGANKAAEAPYQMVTVPQPDGSTRMVPLSSLVGQRPPSSAPATLSVTQGPAPGSGASFGTSQTPQAKVQAEGLTKAGVDYKTGLDSNVSAGSDLMMRIGEARKALDQFKPGMGADTRLQVARFAQSVGLPDGLVKSINNGDVAAKQEFQKLSAQQAMESLKQAMGGTGRITQAEFKVFQANNPNIELDPRAIEKIYNFTQRVQSRNLEEQRALATFIHQGGNVSDWPSMWAQEQARRGYTGPDTGTTQQASGFKYLGKE